MRGERACAAAGARGSLTGGENRRGADMAAGAARLREARLTLRPHASGVVVPQLGPLNSSYRSTLICL